jgi:hypothetical protein
MWMLSSFTREVLRQEQLVEFKGVAASAPRIEKYGKGNRTVAIDVRGVSHPLSLNTYAYSALERRFLSDVVAGDTVILGLERDVYTRRILRQEEGGMMEGTNIEVFTVATPKRQYASVGEFNAAKQKDSRLGWVIGPLVLLFLGVTWFKKRRVDQTPVLVALPLVAVGILVVFLWNRYY